jgi:hypothetical protein
VYADGASTAGAPETYCTEFIEDCQTNHGAKATLQSRPGMPAQISVPSEVSDTPWLVITQTATADGTPLPPTQELLTPGRTLAYTAEPDQPDERILVIEVQQLGVQADEQGRVVVDDGGVPQLRPRGLWTVEFTPGK